MTRQRALHGVRLAFVVLTVACAWWGFRGRWSEIGDAVTATGPARLAAAVTCAALGLAVTGLVWRLLLKWIGAEVAPRDAAAVFFVGQLGKYVPGSVWSIAAQAHLGRRHGVPARSSVTASSLFLLVHTATGLLLGGALVASGSFGDGAPEGIGTWWSYAALAVGALALAPPLVRGLANRLAGRSGGTVLGAGELVVTVALMAVVWVCYGASLLLLVPGDGPGLVGAAAVFALAHAAGVLVVFAPAGVGAREGVLVALLAPMVGLPGAVAVALLSRVCHAVADFMVAGAATGWARNDRSVRATQPARASGQ